MWQVPISSMHSRDWPMPPPMDWGSWPFSSILWKGSSRRWLQFAAVSWRSRAAASTRMPMEDSSKLRSRMGFHMRISPFSSQSS